VSTPGSDPTLDRLIGVLATAGATLGIIAGLVDVAVGPSIRGWVGNKLNTSILGIATIALSALALAAAIAWQRNGSRVGLRRLGTAVALAVPAILCFTTIGRLWYLPGSILLIAAATILVNSTREDFEGAMNARRWLRGLLVILGGFYVFLGADALGLAGALGIAGGLGIWAVLAHDSALRRASFAVIALCALPFAIATWWSAVTPLIALLMLVLGASAELPGRTNLDGRGLIRHGRRSLTRGP
jgi:hypothetical protein